MEDLDFSHLHVEFFMDTKESKRESEEQGRPIFKDVEKVRIRMAGDKGTELVAPAHSGSSVRDPVTNRRLTYAELHRKPYEAFKANVEYMGEGTPLRELPFISNARAKELNALNIYSAEALAQLDGDALKRAGMGTRDLKNQAKAYLDKAASGAIISGVTQENEALRKQVEELTARMDQLSAASTEEPPATASETSPFKDWKGEDIANWIVDNGGEKPHHKCAHGTLVQKADELNARIAKQNEAA